MKKHATQLLILTCILSGFVFFQSCEDEHTHAEASRPEWRNYRKENSGIVDNNILSLAVDDSDRIVVGHAGFGLSRYDGATWKHLIATGSVTRISSAGFGHLWILVNASAYRLDDDHLTAGGLLGMDPSSGLDNLATDNFGTVYASLRQYVNWTSYSKIVRFRTGVSTIFTISFGENFYSGIDIGALWADRDTLWMGTRIQDNVGVLRMDNEHPYGVNLPSLPNTGWRYNAPTILHRDREHRLCAGTPLGLYRLDGTSWTSFDRSDVPPYPVLSISGDDNSFWVGGTGGFAHWDGSAWEAFPHDKALINQSITSLVLDRKGNLWIGTAGGGLYEYHAGGIIP